MSAERLATLRQTVDRKMHELSQTRDRRRRADLEREIRAAQAEIDRLRPVTPERTAVVRRALLDEWIDMETTRPAGMLGVDEVVSRQGRVFSDFVTDRFAEEVMHGPVFPGLSSERRVSRVHDEIIVDVAHAPRLRTFNFASALQEQANLVSAGELARTHGTGPQLTEAVVRRNADFGEVIRQANRDSLERIARENPELIEELLAKREPAKVAPTPGGRRLVL